MHVIKASNFSLVGSHFILIHTRKTNPEAQFSKQNNINYTSGPKKDPKISDCQIFDAMSIFGVGSVSKWTLMFCEFY